MSMETHERPGVYSSYEASAVVNGSGGYHVVGAVGRADTGTVGKAVTVTSLAAAVQEFGENDGGSGLVNLVRMALLNGAPAVVAVAAAVGTDEPTLAQYTSAFEVMAGEDGVDIVICGSDLIGVQQALMRSVQSASELRRERIGVAGGASGETVSALVSRAADLNSERMVLAAPEGIGEDGVTVLTGPAVAAAVAGAIAGESDPAVPLGGAVLKGFGGVSVKYSDNDIDLLVRGGVTPLECVGGVVSVVRGVTTRTTSGGASDSTWRELSTILIVDDVIPTVRDALRGKFARSKNTAQTRGAIRSQVILELDNKVSREIIADYGDVSVTVDAETPTVCLVDFTFSVAHGLNQIYLTAHITV